MTSITFEHLPAHTSFLLPSSATLLYWGKGLCGSDKGINFFRKKGMIFAYFCITGFLLTRWIRSGHLPLSNLYESPMFLSWSLTLIHTTLEVKSKSDWLGIVTAPSAALTHGFATFGLPKEMQESIVSVPAPQSHWSMMHVTAIISGYATLLCGSLSATAFPIVAVMEETDSPITQSHIDPSVCRDPSRHNIDKGFGSEESHKTGSYGNSSKSQLTKELDDRSYRIIGLGFPLSTIGILPGAVRANETWGSYRNRDPKETWALITWFILAIYLHIRIIGGWRGEKPAIVASLGFFVVWIRYLGVNLFGKGLHSYGWWI